MIATVPIENKNIHKTIEFQLDTATTCNMLSRRDYATMGKPQLTTTTQAITTYDDTKVVPDGWCNLTVTDNDNHKQHLNFLVMQTKQHSLLSLNACMSLQLIKINDEHVHLTAEEPIENILVNYEDVFKGVGCLPGEYNLEVDPTVTPVPVRPRKIPLSMKEDVKVKLDALTEQGIIEKVEEPTSWISHLQPVRKANGTVRLCLDPQNLNKALQRNHYDMR